MPVFGGLPAAAGDPPACRLLPSSSLEESQREAICEIVVQMLIAAAFERPELAEGGVEHG